MVFVYILLPPYYIKGDSKFMVQILVGDRKQLDWASKKHHTTPGRNSFFKKVLHRRCQACITVGGCYLIVNFNCMKPFVSFNDVFSCRIFLPSHHFLTKNVSLSSSLPLVFRPCVVSIGKVKSTKFMTLSNFISI